MDLERNIGVHQRLRHVVGLSSGEIVEIVLDLLLSLLVAGGGGLGVDGDIDGAPIRAVEDGGRPDVEEDYGVAWTEIILDSPLHGVSALIAEIDCDGDLPVGPGGGCARREARGSWLPAMLGRQLEWRYGMGFGSVSTTIIKLNLFLIVIDRSSCTKAALNGIGDWALAAGSFIF
nr:hypothetical protein CR513_39626 [Ipomoea batatas]